MIHLIHTENQERDSNIITECDTRMGRIAPHQIDDEPEYATSRPFRACIGIAPGEMSLEGICPDCLEIFKKS